MKPNDPRGLIAEVRGEGWTQGAVAAEIGVSQGTISKISRGETKEMRSGAFMGLLKLHSRVVKKTTAKAVTQ